MSIPTLRDISIVIIALELFLMLLIPLVISYFAVRGINWVHRKLRYYFPMVQDKFRLVSEVADKASQKVAAPIIAIDAFSARVRRMRDVL